MNPHTERLAARNEDLFREVNEAIERGMWLADPSKLIRFRCECSDMACGEAVEATLQEYEHVRRSPRRFLVADGHVLPEVEDVVDKTDRYLVVEKKGIAGEISETDDPRSDD